MSTNHSTPRNTAQLLSDMSPKLSAAQTATQASMKEVTPNQGLSTPIVAGSSDSSPKGTAKVSSSFIPNEASDKYK